MTNQNKQEIRDILRSAGLIPEVKLGGVWEYNLVAIVCEEIKKAVEAERERIKTDINNIWKKHHINNTEDDGFRDSENTVINKFVSALKEQMVYLYPTQDN